MSSSEAALPLEAPVRIVFLTRDPVVHERSGSTTYIRSLLQLLQRGGAEVTVVVTTAASRSPRLAFRVASGLPAGATLQVPGYLRLGSWYLLPFRHRAWARALSRLGARTRPLRWVIPQLQRRYGSALFTGAWDLTLPLPGEVELAESFLAGAEVLILNYAFWGAALAQGRLRAPRTAILMHDLLSARVHRFEQSGTPLDMPHITEQEEMRWLAAADTLLAAQASEAEVVRSRTPARVLVTPVMLSPQSLPEAEILAGRCLFVGSNILPNRTGLEFLLTAVWPRVREKVPGATLAVAGTVGRVLGDRAGSMASLGVQVLGVVPELRTEYARAAVCLVPLLMGTGIKIKLLEALGYGKAIVSTAVGVEGLERWAGEAVEIAEEAEDFAAAVVRLLQDESWRRQRQADALRMAQAQFGPDRPLDADFQDALLRRR